MTAPLDTPPPHLLVAHINALLRELHTRADEPFELNYGDLQVTLWPAHNVFDHDRAAVALEGEGEVRVHWQGDQLRLDVYQEDVTDPTYEYRIDRAELLPPPSDEE